ncbi:MAG: hypothetical protein QMD46_04555 [Methanomicrobiales archaeon]|nr:hypothetical protein [Methanomicrobiales archaeon]MDI6876583.1 hypothetical protein [Methanomicrobiales archaeon]
MAKIDPATDIPGSSRSIMGNPAPVGHRAARYGWKGAPPISWNDLVVGLRAAPMRALMPGSGSKLPELPQKLPHRQKPFFPDEGKYPDDFIHRDPAAMQY